MALQASQKFFTPPASKESVFKDTDCLNSQLTVVFTCSFCCAEFDVDNCCSWVDNSAFDDSDDSGICAVSDSSGSSGSVGLKKDPCSF